jgi:hypothetical protein
MKKLILIFVLIPCLVSAGQIQDMQKAVLQKMSAGGGGTTDNCPDATYNFAWTGDNTSGVTYACKDNGTSSVNTASTGSGYATGSSYGESGNGVRFSAANQYLLWTASGGDIIDDETCTIWYSIRAEDSNFSGQTFMESYSDSNNRFYAYVHDEDDLAAYANGNGTAESWSDGADVSDGAWKRRAISWNSATNKLSLYDGSDWSETTSSTYTAWNSQDPDDFTLGENEASAYAETKNIDIDSVYIIVGTYQAGDPEP